MNKRIPPIPTPAPTLYLLRDVELWTPLASTGAAGDPVRGTRASSHGPARATFSAAEAEAWRAGVSEFAPEVAALPHEHWNACVMICQDPHDPATSPHELRRYRKAWTALHEPQLEEHPAFAILEEVWEHDGTCLTLAMAGMRDADRLLIEARDLVALWLQGLAEPDIDAATRLRDEFRAVIRSDRPHAIARSRHLDYVETRGG